MLYSRKLTDHCKPAIMEKNKNHYIKKIKKIKSKVNYVPFSCFYFTYFAVREISKNICYMSKSSAYVLF